MVLAGGGPIPSQHRAQRTIIEREPKDSLWEVSEHWKVWKKLWGVADLLSKLSVSDCTFRAHWDRELRLRSHPPAINQTTLRDKACRREPLSFNAAGRPLLQQVQPTYLSSWKKNWSFRCRGIANSPERQVISVSDCTKCALWDRETQNHQILLLILCLRLHEMCTLRQWDSESPSSALRSLSQTARNVHSETERLRITRSPHLQVQPTYLSSWKENWSFRCRGVANSPERQVSLSRSVHLLTKPSCKAF